MSVRFGACELDLDRLELRRDGQVVPIEPQVFEVLAYLVAQRPRAVTKQELLDAVWGTRFVSESALTSRIKSARRAVGDTGREQQVIRTIHGRGYRFVADVEDDDPGRPPADTTRHDRRATDRPAGAVPVAPTPLVGRAAELAALRQAVRAARLVTVVGAGGIGKTRLVTAFAVEEARERRDGAWFVDLVRVTDPAAVVAAVAEAVGAPQVAGGTPIEALVASLHHRDGLLVLDNCEHLVDGVRECVDRIVAACPLVTILTTSRIRMMLPYEHPYAVPGLAVTGDGGDAVDLFVERALAATGEATPPDAGRVAALCQALDGIPLAIELAAARYATLGMDGLEAGLHERMQLLSVSGPGGGRHSSLRATLTWSNDLLSADDQALLRGVALFASWFDVAAAREVAAPAASRSTVANGLAQLADHSLLVVDRGRPTRYRALETVRQFLEEHLRAAGELDDVHTRHDGWCRAMLDDLALGPPDDAWAGRFDLVVDDARGALVRAVGGDDPDRAADLAERLAGELWRRGRLVESQRRYEQAAELSTGPADQARNLRAAAGAALTRLAGVDHLRLLRRSADVALAAGDRDGATLDLAWMALTIARSPGTMAEPHSQEEAAALLDDAVATSAGSPAAEATMSVAAAYLAYRELTIARVEQVAEMAGDAGASTAQDAALDLLVAVHLKFDDLPGAVEAVRRRQEVVDSLPVVPANGFELGDHYQFAAEILLAAGDLPGAATHADRLAALPFIRVDEFIGIARHLKVGALAGHFDAVLRDAERFRRSWERAGRPVVPNLASCAHAVAMVHGIRRDDVGRAAWVQIADGLLGGRFSPSGVVWRPTFDAIVALHRGEPEVASELLAVDVDDAETWWTSDVNVYRPWYAAAWAEAAVLTGRDDHADRVARARRATRDNPVAAAIVERAAVIGDRVALGAIARTFERLGCPYQQGRTEELAAPIADP